ncbi:BrnT family toxin [Duganella sp. BJB475]|uniref:BrnT family toxin n=1 Tax=unclassified Duganella TaxID=2636909 RepID=UPI000E34A8BB|nr:BrnT family toxin [Duganella sp. BJB475]RFP35136.1 BrnT family toxin [Duganella sp. BJB476]
MTTYTWDETKRLSNLRKHGLDFADAPPVIEGAYSTVEDVRFRYSERRYNAYSYFQTYAAVVTYAEENDEIRIISFRKATKREANEIFRRPG